MQELTFIKLQVIPYILTPTMQNAYMPLLLVRCPLKNNVTSLNLGVFD